MTWMIRGYFCGLGNIGSTGELLGNPQKSTVPRKIIELNGGFSSSFHV
jgi:hypothetical protein